MAGTVTSRGSGSRTACRKRGAFRGTLRRVEPSAAPGAWEDCEDVERRRGGRVVAMVEVDDRDVGCTAARAAGRALRDRAAAGRPLCDPGGCGLAALACVAVSCGEREPAAQVRCAPPGGQDAAVELTFGAVCAYGDGGEYAPLPVAFNVPCGEARAVTRSWEDEDACSQERVGGRCRLAAHDCAVVRSPHPDVAVTRCAARADPRRVVEIYEPLTL